MVAKGGRGGWNGGGNTISSILYPEGSRYLEAEGRGGESRCMGIQRSLHMHARQTYELAVAGGEITLKGRSKQWI